MTAPVPIEHESAAPWLTQRAQRDPHRLALRCDGVDLSFSQLAQGARAWAARLWAAGLRPCDRMALIMDPSPTMVELIHAVQFCGAALVPINTRLTPSEIVPLLQDCSPLLIIYDRTYGAAIASAEAGLRDRSLEISELLAAAPAADWREVPPDSGAIHSIIYTSGTTGRAKGAMLTNGNIAASARASRLHLGIASKDRWLAVLPLHHIGGLSILLRSVLDGTGVILHRRFDAAAANRAIRDDHATLVSVVATMLMRMFDENGPNPYPASLRCVLLGGGPVPEILVRRALELGVRVAPTYGLTETASQVATASPDQVAAKPQSCGLPLPGTQIVIGSPDREGRGEILVRGPTVMAGYLNQPEATASAMRDGWLHTGDIGRLDHGHLYIHDRRDDLIVSGGENVYPAEVEGVLLEHPAVAEAAVFALPDLRWGHRVAAAVVQRPGIAGDGATLAAWCETRLARFKVPRSYYLVDALPRTASGKLRRHVLREKFSNETS